MRFGVVAVGLVILVAGAISVSAGVPTVWSPFPLLTVIPAFLVASTPINHPDFAFRDMALPVFAAVPIAIAFGAWSMRPVANSQVPMRSFILYALITSLTIIDFVGSWNYGLKYQGLAHTAVLASINCLLAAGVCALFLWHRARPSQALSLAFHGMLFLWLAGFAFPWLGELP